MWKNCNDRGWGTRLTPKNSHESIIMSMIIDAQPAHSIDEHLLCVYSINI